MPQDETTSEGSGEESTTSQNMDITTSSASDSTTTSSDGTATSNGDASTVEELNWSQFPTETSPGSGALPGDLGSINRFID